MPIALLRARESTLAPFRADLDRIGLTVQQWRVIRALAEGEPRTAGELSEICVLMPPSLSRIMKALTERGFIARVEDGDARRRRVRLTAAGREKYAEMAERSAEIYARLEAAFGTDRMEALLDLLTELRETSDRLNADD
ncbi:homoprotocatechuate degradation operon regulator, HpaR [Sinisalibacter aestuarii]|uniref:Homoprotocatechuate degradation operon regulator, HpaR n=1 Tax=Sinisalibacter aestuarii TaxID=2949426 RepID=A0ABQ5LQB6_9RHOB|nr:homoprotocatechuate degradation operon regulator, HpaR [Sinisalibacter aestuarii]